MDLANLTLTRREKQTLVELSQAARYPIVRFELHSSEEEELLSVALDAVRITETDDSMELVKERGRRPAATWPSWASVCIDYDRHRVGGEAITTCITAAGCTSCSAAPPWRRRRGPASCSTSPCLRKGRATPDEDKGLEASAVLRTDPRQAGTKTRPPDGRPLRGACALLMPFWRGQRPCGPPCCWIRLRQGAGEQRVPLRQLFRGKGRAVPPSRAPSMLPGVLALPSGRRRWPPQCPARRPPCPRSSRAGNGEQPLRILRVGGVQDAERPCTRRRSAPPKPRSSAALLPQPCSRS